MFEKRAALSAVEEQIAKEGICQEELLYSRAYDSKVKGFSIRKDTQDGVAADHFMYLLELCPTSGVEAASCKEVSNSNVKRAANRRARSILRGSAETIHLDKCRLCCKQSKFSESYSLRERHRSCPTVKFDSDEFCRFPETMICFLAGMQEIC